MQRKEIEKIYLKKIKELKKYDEAYFEQDSPIISDKDYEGKIYVADFFFTTCQSICPKMTNNMAWLQNKIKNNPKVKLVSFSVTPDIDSVPVLKSYAQKKGVIDSKWNLLTGDKKEISPGDMVKVVVEKLSGHSLRGKAVSVNRADKKIPMESEIPVSTR